MTRQEVAQDVDVSSLLRDLARHRGKQASGVDAVRAWRAACAFLQLQLSREADRTWTGKDQILDLLVAVQSCACRCLHGQPDLQYHHAALMYQHVRRLHDKQALVALWPVSSALLQFLDQHAAADLHERCNSLRQGCITASIAALQHTEQLRPAFCELAAAVVRSQEAWPLAHRLLVNRLRMKSAALEFDELQSTLALLDSAGGEDARKVAEKLLPHVIALSASSALLQHIEDAVQIDDSASLTVTACELAAKQLVHQPHNEKLHSSAEPTSSAKLWLRFACALAMPAAAPAHSKSSTHSAWGDLQTDSTNLAVVRQGLLTSAHPCARALLSCCLQSASRSLLRIADAGKESMLAEEANLFLQDAQLAASAFFAAAPQLPAGTSASQISSVLDLCSAAHQLALRIVRGDDGKAACQAAEDMAQLGQHAIAILEGMLCMQQLDGSLLLSIRYACLLFNARKRGRLTVPPPPASLST